MPICKEDRSNENGRSALCLEEHFLPEEECFMCENYVQGMPFLVKDQVNLNKRRTKRHRKKVLFFTNKTPDWHLMWHTLSSIAQN